MTKYKDTLNHLVGVQKKIKSTMEKNGFPAKWTDFKKELTNRNDKTTLDIKTLKEDLHEVLLEKFETKEEYEHAIDVFRGDISIYIKDKDVKQRICDNIEKKKNFLERV